MNVDNDKNALTTDVKCESEHIDDKQEDDVLCDLLSSHMNEVNARLSGDASDVVDVLQADVAETQNSWDLATVGSNRLNSPSVEKTDAWNTPFPFIWCKTPADEVNLFSYECGQRQDNKNALTSTLTTDVKCESEHIDDKGEDDVLYDLLSSHMNEVNARLSGDASNVVDVLQADVAETQNSWDPATVSSNRLNSPSVEKTNVCSVCHKTFRLSSLPASHRHIYTGVTPHACPVCLECYNSMRTPRKWILICTDEWPYVCHICTHAFKKSSVLIKHLETHSVERQHRCNVCQKKFTRRGNIHKHLLIHTGERAHKCHVCHKRFMQRRDLNIHMVVHTGEKQHRCDICHRQFNHHCNFRRHMLLHSGERRYKCSVCQKRFTQCSHLKRHQLTHTGEKPHKCDMCHKQFARPDHLKHHMRTHTVERHTDAV